MRIDAGDNLAVKLQYQTQYAVRGRMLRTKVDREVAEILRLLVHGFGSAFAFSSPGKG